MNPNLESTPAKPGEIRSFWVLGARLTWIIVGPVALLGISYGIVYGGYGWLTGLDAAFGTVAGLMLLGRWSEQRSGSATTLTGEPATSEQLKRYVTILIPAAAALWVIANLVGNHVLK
jgi:hypothetical protein